MNAWIRYSLARLGIFGAVFALLSVVGITWWVSLIFATLISFTAGYVFFHRTREELASQLQKRRNTKQKQRVDDDALAEDSAQSES